MSTTKDGGPAFPVVTGAIGARESDPEYNIQSSGGMTVRQVYKAAALQGLLANDAYGEEGYSKLAEWAGSQADAMLAEDEEHAKS